MIDRLFHDLFFALRGFAKEPGWTAAAVLTLALAIGATTATFTVVDAVLLEPLPYEESHRLVAIGAHDIANDRGSVAGWVSYPVFDALHRAQQPLEGLAAYSETRVTALVHGGAERMLAARATASVFSTLRTPPLLGRVYTEENDIEKGQGAVLLSHGFWQRRFGGDPDVLGDTLTVNENVYDIVGVMPRDFAFPSEEVQFWISMANESRSPRNFLLHMLGRLQPGVGLQQAAAQMRALAVDVPNNPSRATEGYAGLVQPLHEVIVADIEPQLVIFMAAVSAVLLIACINVVNLMLSRATGRWKERTVRAALGATRARLVQQHLTESAVLGAAGAALGLALAAFLTVALIRLSPVSVPRQGEIGIDGGVLLFTLVLAVGVSLAVGLLSALQGSAGDLVGGLREAASRSSSGGPRSQRLRGSLIVAQIAMAVVLLFSATLLLQTLAGLLGVERGYDADEVLTLSTSLPTATYPDFPSRAALYERVLERIRGLPGVRSASMSMLLPFEGQWTYGFIIEGYTPQEDERMAADFLSVTPGFFDTLGVPLLAGRGFTEQDEDAVIINQTMARTYWPGRSPLGARVALGGEDPATVIGVVNDTRFTSLEGEDSPQVYAPYGEGDTFDMMLYVRSGGDPRELIVPIRESSAPPTARSPSPTS